MRLACPVKKFINESKFRKKKYAKKRYNEDYETRHDIRIPIRCARALENYKYPKVISELVMSEQAVADINFHLDFEQPCQQFTLNAMY